MRKSRAKMSGKIQIHNMILNFPTQDFLIQKIKEREIKKKIFVVLYPIFLYTLLHTYYIVDELDSTIILFSDQAQ